jgi:autotransporter-associated beta strand protein
MAPCRDGLESGRIAKLYHCDGGTTGSIIGNVTDNATLAFDRSGPEKTFSGVISGSGSLVKLGSDTLVLTADNTYSGGTTIQDPGVLRLARWSHHRNSKSMGGLGA